ncbi:MAG TPA: hypothetical protein VEV83_17455 [Parafilimonas sp.]|nr:hypothetical protein [Parafilimonas sp.]
MSVLIFVVYFVLVSFLITKIPFFKKSGLSTYWLIGLFSLKIAAGIAYGLFYSQPQYAEGSDTWRFFEASRTETDWLLRDPLAFFKDLFFYGYKESGSLFLANDSYWNDLKSNLVIKLMAAFNALTLKNYYADIIFFNFLFLFGPVALYRVAREKVNPHNIILVLFVFCIPSFLFWCSGMHKDGLIFTAVSLIAFYFDRWLTKKSFSLTGILVSLVSICLLFAFRNFVLLLLLPALLTWWLCERMPARKTLAVVEVYILCLALFFAARHVNPALDFPRYVVSKQNEFKALGGHSQIMLPALEPSFGGFLKFFPAAADIAFLRPHVTETANLAYLPAIGENIVVYLLLLYALFRFFFNRSEKFSASAASFVIFCYCFAITNLILSGYTVTLTGAIVRYRSFVLPLLLVPLSNLIHIKKKRHNLNRA